MSVNKPIEIRPVTTGDAGAISQIYNWYVLNSTATFEIDSVAEEEIAKRIHQIAGENPWLVAEISGQVVGYAYGSAWKSRPAYRQARETSVYVHREFYGNGVGEVLMSRLMDEFAKTPIHCLIAGITLPNEASVALHEKLGFKAIGEFEEVGYKFGAFINVGYWQLILDVK